jgi:hypothetical protein
LSPAASHTFPQGKKRQSARTAQARSVARSSYQNLLAETATIPRNGKMTVMTRAEILAHTIYQSGAKGNTSAINAILKLAPELKEAVLDTAKGALQGELAQGNDAEPGLTEADLETMRWLLHGHEEETDTELMKELAAELEQAGGQQDDDEQ